MTQYEDDIDNMMPIDCLKCGDIFDLSEGYESKKWFPNKTICPNCSELEDKEIETDEEIEDLNNLIDDAKITIRESVGRLNELGVTISVSIVTTH